MNFNTVRWQEDTVNNLKCCIKNHTLGHALLFSGEKETCHNIANAVADSLLCEQPFDGQACGACGGCAKTNADTHPDKLIVTAEKATIGVGEIREFINNVYTKPFISERKVCIFEDASKLTPSAQNALLKLLEAPPDYCVIILITEQQEDLLSTVLSRLKKYKLKIPTGLEVGQYLAKKYPEKRELAMFCGKFCEGSSNGAEQLLKNGGNFDKRKRLCIFLKKLAGSQKTAVFDFANYLSEDKSDFSNYVSYLDAILRDILFINHKINGNLIINTDLISEISELGKYYSAPCINKISNMLSDAYSDICGNAALKLTVTNLALKIWEAIHDRDSRN